MTEPSYHSYSSRQMTHPFTDHTNSNFDERHFFITTPRAAHHNTCPFTSQHEIHSCTERSCRPGQLPRPPFLGCSQGRLATTLFHHRQVLSERRGESCPATFTSGTFFRQTFLRSAAFRHARRSCPAHAPAPSSSRPHEKHQFQLDISVNSYTLIEFLSPGKNLHGD